MLRALRERGDLKGPMPARYGRVMLKLQGIAVSPGVTIGEALVLDSEGFRIPRRFVARSAVDSELERLARAVADTAKEIERNRDAIELELGGQYAAIFEAHLAMLHDTRLQEELQSAVRDRNWWPEYAVSRTLRRYAKVFQNLDNHIAQRAHDIYDIEKSLLRNLLGERRETLADISQPVIVLAHNLTPSETANLDRRFVQGFATELGGPVIPTVLPGVQSVHAVDASGVHPLLLAVGSERYMPWKNDTRPSELLTQASAILGQGQLSLAKYLFIVSQGDAPGLKAHQIRPFFSHLLERVDWLRDCHFHTETTIDTLDYSGSGLNCGSKLVVAARGPAIRSLPREIPAGWSLPNGFYAPRVCLPGVVAVTGPAIEPKPQMSSSGTDDAAIWRISASAPWSADIERLVSTIRDDHPLRSWPLVVIVDDSEFASASLENFLWITFTRSSESEKIRSIRFCVP